MSNVNHDVPALNLEPFDTIVDLVGNPHGADLVLFLNGNQFMVMPELLSGFRRIHPEFSRIYYETLPPGLLAQQILAKGHIRIGSLDLTVSPDVYTAGRAEMQQLADYIDTAAPYSQNQLALLVPRDNPRHLTGFADLSRFDVRVAMPNPATEGIARLAMEAIRRVSGDAAVQSVFEDKVKNGSCRLTTVHHRETVPWLLSGDQDVGVVWRSEALWAERQGQPVESLPLNDWKENPTGQYWAARLARAPHPVAGQAYLNYLHSPDAEAIYERYGFSAVQTSETFGGF